MNTHCVPWTASGCHDTAVGKHTGSDREEILVEVQNSEEIRSLVLLVVHAAGWCDCEIGKGDSTRKGG